MHFLSTEPKQIYNASFLCCLKLIKMQGCFSQEEEWRTHVKNSRGRYLEQTDDYNYIIMDMCLWLKKSGISIYELVLQQPPYSFTYFFPSHVGKVHTDKNWCHTFWWERYLFDIYSKNCNMIHIYKSGLIYWM